MIPSPPADPPPRAFIYVDPERGRDDAGPRAAFAEARAAPMRTLQAAIGKLHPGCAIVARSGTPEAPIEYRGSLRIGKAQSGAPGAPVWLVAETPRGAAILGDRTPDHNETRAAILASDASALRVHNFTLIPRQIPGNNDSAGFLGVAAPTGRVGVGDVRVCGCRIFGSGEDAIKFTTMRDVWILGNRFEGGNFQESVIDLVSVHDAVIAWNTAVGAWRDGMTFKGGSLRTMAFGNRIDIESDKEAMTLGESGSSRWWRPQPHVGERWEWAELQDAVIVGNLLRTTARNALRSRGAFNAVVEGNALSAAEVAYIGSTAQSRLWRDQTDVVPAEHRRAVAIRDDVFDPVGRSPRGFGGAQTRRGVCYASRRNTIQGNLVARDLLLRDRSLRPGWSVIEGEGDVFADNAFEPFDPQTFAPGDAGWNATMIYRNLGHA